MRHFQTPTKEQHGGKSILAEFLQPLEHASYQVARHEDHGQLVVVLVVTPPDGIVFFVELFPEVGD